MTYQFLILVTDKSFERRCQNLSEVGSKFIMKLSNLIATLDSQIPIAALDVLSPDEATIIQWLTIEV
ncbi:MAG: hypothetical protein ACYT04_99730, partial [Nostoc sp.]